VIKKHPQGVNLTQVADRENNIYIKKVLDEQTKEVIKDITEPLDKHHHQEKRF
jgi:hypothetical protein